VNLPEADVDALDNLVKQKYFPHRNEAIRAAVRDLIRIYIRDKKEKAKEA
jgi:metal-responsive CopG/Arc/MetJ family transcriptional regulator